MKKETREIKGPGADQYLLRQENVQQNEQKNEYAYLDHGKFNDKDNEDM
ncbi:hypothetical protein [Ornithinibacillus bavariensis]|uniref:Uncharacterized protein n=1 Tax=Ornithinibacillus bavariensis TaxID=545502 RepID=A0A919X9V3_9BACI|nr:hypothetical protein [Ornithinibacillus bavariensis]GIO28716.1 hypothetical protein J43TS3_33270 [Ornithinibacillus bavariensis]